MQAVLVRIDPLPSTHHSYLCEETQRIAERHLAGMGRAAKTRLQSRQVRLETRCPGREEAAEIIVPQAARHERPASIGSVEILVVEDEEGIADFLSRGLGAEGYEVTVVGDGLAGERLALSGAADLVVLDRMLPGRDGIDVLSAIREKKPTLPVIMLTAKAEVADLVEGLDLGATDYVTKPFAFEELLARIRSRLRESGNSAETTLQAGGIRLDLLSREATRGELAVRLPEREANLLAHLLRNAGHICSREEILTAVWDYDHDPRTNVVQVYVGYLRRKLGLPDSPAPIETVRSVGYRLKDSQG